jgi:hypothetical protein
MTGMPRKLVVEVLAAKALMPKDGEGSSNAYCVVICSTCVVHLFLFLALRAWRPFGLVDFQ